MVKRHDFKSPSSSKNYQDGQKKAKKSFFLAKTKIMRISPLNKTFSKMWPYNLFFGIHTPFIKDVSRVIKMELKRIVVKILVRNKIDT